MRPQEEQVKSLNKMEAHKHITQKSTEKYVLKTTLQKREKLISNPDKCTCWMTQEDIDPSIAKAMKVRRIVNFVDLFCCEPWQHLRFHFRLACPFLITKKGTFQI